MSSMASRPRETNVPYVNHNEDEDKYGTQTKYDDELLYHYDADGLDLKNQ
jgi:hypothetical protein